MYWTVSLDGGPKRVNHAAAKVGHHIYSFGGYNKNTDFEELLPISVYDLNTATLRWTEIKAGSNDVECCPFQRYGHTAVEYGTDIIIWGGRNDIKGCNKIFVFDSRKKEWRRPEVTGSIPLPRDGHSACVINDRMYIFGGFLDDLNVFSDDVYYLDLKTMCWTQVRVSGNLRPPGRDFHSATVIGSRMYIIGGRGHSSESPDEYSNAEEYWSTVFYFETKTNTWHEPILKGKIPVGRRSLSTFVFNGLIYMFGGCNGSLEKHFNDVDVFNPATAEWKEVKPLGKAPSERRRQSCVLVGNLAFIFGGSRPKPQHERPFNFLPFPPEIQMYLDTQCPDLDDLDDLHVLELETPSLKTLCSLVVIKENLETNSLPLQLQHEIKNMVTPNSISP